MTKPEQGTKLYPSQIRKLVQEILEEDLEKVRHITSFHFISPHKLKMYMKGR